MIDDASVPLLAVDDLRVEFDTMAGVVQGLRGVSLSVGRGETLGLVGESGSGKSVTAQAIMGLTDAPGRLAGGDVRWKGRSLFSAEGAKWARSVRGKELAMVFQDPMTSLNPLMSIGAQIVEVLVEHLRLTKTQARTRAIDLLGAVGISAPARRLDQLPHELSGGMRQRVIIAMAIACEPQLLIADEPTTALDVTIQAQILELLMRLQQQLGLAIVFITHDLGVVAGLCHRVSVMYAGRIMETGPVDDIFARPRHVYTRRLLLSTPRLDDNRERLPTIEGMPPNLIRPPVGCPFRPRCPEAGAECEATPPLIVTGESASAACWHA